MISAGRERQRGRFSRVHRAPRYFRTLAIEQFSETGVCRPRRVSAGERE